MIQELDQIEQLAQRIQNIPWGYDGDCGAKAIADDILEAVSRLKNKVPTDEEIERIIEGRMRFRFPGNPEEMGADEEKESQGYCEGVGDGLRYYRDNYSLPSPSVDGWISDIDEPEIWAMAYAVSAARWVETSIEYNECAAEIAERLKAIFLKASPPQEHPPLTEQQ